MNFKSKLKSDTPLFGTLVSLSDPASVDCLSRIGYDWLWIDMEHSPLSLQNVRSMLDAKDDACAALVRVPVNSAEWIKRVLDMGPEGIIVPHVDSKEAAIKAVGAAKYPPSGFRSYGPGRASHYGLKSNYVQHANDDVVVAIQIEHKHAVDTLDEILSVEGIDAVVVGPYDLSGSYGKLGAITDSEVEEALVKIQQVCKNKKITPGIFCPNVDFAQQQMKKGYRLLNVGVDINTLWQAAKATVETLKK